MRDTLTIGTIAGIIASAVMACFTLIVRLLGFKFIATWETAAHIFLNWDLIHTPTGYIIGLLGQLILGAFFGVTVAYTLRLTGKDYYILKGIGVGALIWMGSIGFFMKLLHIAIQGRGDPVSNLLAIIQFHIMGVISAIIIKKYAKFGVKR